MHNRAFSLIKAAIVLGIVGLVISGIWAAASSISASRRANNMRIAMMHIFSYIDTHRQHFTVVHYPIPVFLKGLAGYTLSGETLMGEKSNIRANWTYDEAADPAANNLDLFVEFTYDGMDPDPQSCIALSKLLLTRKYLGFGVITWQAAANTGSMEDLLAWYVATDPAPSLSAIMSVCNKTGRLNAQIYPQ